MGHTLFVEINVSVQLVLIVLNSCNPFEFSKSPVLNPKPLKFGAKLCNDIWCLTASKFPSFLWLKRHFSKCVQSGGGMAEWKHKKEVTEGGNEKRGKLRFLTACWSCYVSSKVQRNLWSIHIWDLRNEMWIQPKICCIVKIDAQTDTLNQEMNLHWACKIYANS